jgi:hypothetical protein
MNMISPFWKGNIDEKLIDEVSELVKKYGYEQFFIAYSEVVNEDEENWLAQSNVISEGMLECLEENAIPYMKEILEDNNEENNE